MLFCLILPLEYFTAGIFYYWVISLSQYAFYCANVSAVGNVFGPFHNPYQSYPRPRV